MTGHSRLRPLACIAALLAAAMAGEAADFAAGLGRTKITPDGPIWLSGFMSRTAPSQGVHDDLWAKALALRDGNGALTLIVTADLVAIPGPMADRVAARFEKRFHVPRERILINVSHTHTGPVVWGALPTLAELDPRQESVAKGYAARLERALEDVGRGAIADLKPATLAFGSGSVGFAANRRMITPSGVKFGVNRSGPSDHDVPVLRIDSPDGKLRAVLFGYACHNTTIGSDLHISADWAGMAKTALERAHPGATALFLALCGGDQGPDPKGSFDEARQNGESLAREVERVLSAKLDAVAGPLTARYRVIRLDFAPQSKEAFEQELRGKDGAQARRAKLMLRAHAEGKPVLDIPYPVQVLRFGRGLAIVALGGEVVVDYALRLKERFPGEPLIVAGYSNDVMCYIPSARVLKEGGYEAVTAMKLYGLPGPLTPDVEPKILAAVEDLLRRTSDASGR